MTIDQNQMEQSKHAGYLRRLASGSMFSVVNLFIGIIISFIMAPIMVHTLGDRYNGIWVIAGSVTGWYAILDFGLSHAVSRFFTKSFSTGDHKNCNIYANTGLALYIILGCAALLCSVGVGLGAFYFYPKVEDVNLLSLVIIIFGFSFALDFPLRVFYGVTTGAMRHDMVGLANMAFRILGALQTCLVLYLGGRLIALAIANAVLVAIQIYVYYLLAKRAFPELQVSRKMVHKTHVKSLFAYSVFGFIAHIGDLFIYQVDNLVISAIISFNAVTHYNIALMLVNNYKGLLMSTSTWMVTWLTFLDARDEQQNMKKAMFFGYKIGTYLSGFIAFGLMFWGKPFITRWMGIEYIDAVPCLVVLVLAATIQAVQEPNIRYLYASSNHRYFAMSNILEGLLNLEISIILALKYGMLGVALGTLIACLVTRGIMIPVFVCRLIKINIFLYYVRLSWYIFRVCIALMVPYLMTEYMVAPNYPRLFLVGGLSALCYFPVIYYIGFSSSDRKQIQGFLFHKK